MGKNTYIAPEVHVEETEAVLPKVEEPEVVTPVVTGMVTDCAKLNVRRAPSMNATVVCAIDRDAEVTINEDKSNAEWYSVCTAAGVNGFCVKKYIEISQ